MGQLSGTQSPWVRGEPAWRYTAHGFIASGKARPLGEESGGTPSSGFKLFCLWGRTVLTRIVDDAIFGNGGDNRPSHLLWIKCLYVLEPLMWKDVTLLLKCGGWQGGVMFESTPICIILYSELPINSVYFVLFEILFWFATILFFTDIATIKNLLTFK